MSTSATIPVFDPQGVLRDVPEGQLAAAVKSGGMPAVKFEAPDKSIRFVPATRYQEAYKAGGTILPLAEQDVKHPGFWSTLYSDAKEIGKSVLNAGPTAGSGDQISRDAAYQEKLIQEGHGIPYRALMSLTPDSMRESAEAGDVGGVAGHTVATAGTMASPLAADAASAAASRGASAVKAVAQAASPVVKTVASKVPEAAGTAAGVYAGHATGIPGAEWAGAQIGRDLGARLAKVFAKSPKEFAAELDATGENKPFAGGMDEWTPKRTGELDATAENKPFAGGMDEASSSVPKRFTPPAEAAPASTAVPTPAQPGAAGQLAESVAKKPANTPVPKSSIPAPSGDPLLDRLRGIARDIEAKEKLKTGAAAEPEKATPGPEQDLTNILLDSLKPENLNYFRARKAAVQ